MLVLAACVIAVLSPLLVARWPAGLVLRQWRWPLLIWIALAIQVVIFEVALAEWLASALHLSTYAMAIAFVWLNRRALGVVVVGVGALLNGVTIALNGGVLPTTEAAVEAAGIEHGDGFDNTAVLDDAVLPWLGDVFAWPEPLPLANTFSVGDVLIVAGVAIAAWTATQRIGVGARASDPAER